MKSKPLDPTQNKVSGILLVNKPKGKTSFSLVSAIRKLYNVKKVGHAGTLDPFATGVMILLIGKDCTRLSDRFLHQDKEYIATLHLGVRTDSYDCDGAVLEENTTIPALSDIEKVLPSFQGEIDQIPPMFSAKKINGKKLYELARKGIEIERKPARVTVDIELLHYEYPLLSIRVACSKGTYIRSLAEDIGAMLGCGAHLSELTRTKSGNFSIEECSPGELLLDPSSIHSLKLINPEDVPFLMKKI